MKELIRFGIILAVICIVASASLAVVYSVTKIKIQEQARLEEEASLKQVMPQGLNFTPIKSGEEVVYYKVLGENDKFIGVAFKASGKGYSSTIETVVGMNKDGTINAIKVMNHNETPGLGSRIAEIMDDTTIWDALRGKKKDTSKLTPWFQEQFKGKPADLKDIQAITGATVSSKAVMGSVRKRAEEIKTLIKDER